MHDILNRRIEGVPLVGLSMINAEYAIGVYRDTLHERNYVIEIYLSLIHICILVDGATTDE